MVTILQYNGVEEEYSSTDEIIERLKAIHKQHISKENVGVIIEKENKEALAVTLGSGQSMLDYFPSNYEDTGIGSYHSINERIKDLGSSEYDPKLDKIYVFFYEGHHSECLLKHTVNIKLAFKVIAEFLENEGLPTLINWELD